MNKKYKSDVGRSIHTVIEGLYNNGTVDKVTMRRFDASCLIPVNELSPQEIKEIRKKLERKSIFPKVFLPTFSMSQKILYRIGNAE